MTPNFAHINGFVFYFFMSDLDEPPHTHVGKGRSYSEDDAKIWLDPVSVSKNGNFNGKDIRKIVSIVKENQQEWLNTWRRYEQSRR